ncbi:MAG: ABC transporter permease [Planctomycetes bacterium]|nr:ABC transporter permease [Planctomycetota bacterium]
MIGRIARLVGAELLKLRRHPFFYVSVLLVVTGTVLGGLFLREERETVWRSYNAISIFAGGARVGLKLATFVMLVFGALLFAGEFDKGTIKVLLTRPIRRSDLFLAKSAVATLLALFLIGTVLYISLAVGCSVGELGMVWDDQSYVSNTSYEALLDHALRAMGMSVLPVIAAAFFGVLVSNLTESSGFAVAITLTLFLLADEIVLRVFQTDEVRRFFFNHYPAYAFDILRDFARGSSTRWKDAFESPVVVPLGSWGSVPIPLGPAYVTVPVLGIATFAAAGFAVFRGRNITA